MQDLLKGLGLGLIGGIAGLVAMRLSQRLASPLVRRRAPRPSDVFATERSISLIGPQHHSDEAATDAIARIAYEKLAHREPSDAEKRRLSWLVHVGYGLAAASLYGALRARGPALAVRRRARGALARPHRQPTAYHPTQHLQSLAAHLGYGVAAQRVMAGDPKFPDSQTLPPFSYAAYARLVGLEGIVMRTPDDIARGWDEAMALRRPVLVEAFTDPEVPPLPPHIEIGQAKKLMASILKGIPSGGTSSRSPRSRCGPV